MQRDSRFCLCGSRLSAARCCDSQPYTSPTPEHVRQLEATELQALQFWQSGNAAAAEALCIDVLESVPDRAIALRVLAEINEAAGRGAAATALLRRLVRIEPNDLWATSKAAMVELADGNLAEAERHSRNAVRLGPENAQSHNLMGMVLTETDRPAAGEYHYRRALELAGNPDPLVLANLGLNMKKQGRIEEARALYRQSIAASPDVGHTLLGWAQLEEADRKFGLAWELAERAESRSAHRPAVALVKAAILARQNRYAEALSTLEAASVGLGRDLSPGEHLERGKILDRLGRYDEAWADFEAGKAKARAMSGNIYRETEVRERTDRLERFFQKSRLDLLPRAGVRTDVPQPIFILGFPRSGTTLLEQTLSTTPAICAGDELPLVQDIINIMPRLLGSPLDYPEALSELWMGDQREGLDTLRDYYLQRVRQMGVLREGAQFFTDKMPLNEIHLGLISLMFPRAPLIHMVRHPFDVIVSAMSNFYSHGAFCSTRLETAAQHLVLSSDLVEKYRSEMGLNYLRVRYEDIVEDQEQTIRKVFNFIGTPFDPAVLRFENNVRYARTASYAQVTEKLYDRSRYRYRNYLEHLRPVAPMLGSLISKLGYTI